MVLHARLVEPERRVGTVPAAADEPAAGPADARSNGHANGNGRAAPDRASEEVTGSRPEARPPRWPVVLAVVVGLVGTALRLRHYLLNQSLWLDEALLARNVVERSYLELFDPLGGQQGAPVGYLWAIKGLTDLLAFDERWLRLPSLLAGVGLMPLVWMLTSRLLSRRSAAFAVTLVALSPGLIRYSAEQKQYALDAAIVVGLLLSAVVVDRGRSTLSMVVLAIGGADAIWFSHAAVLVLPGIGLVLLARPVRQRDWWELRRVALVAATWLASLAGLWMANLRHLTQNDSLTDYWSSGFPDEPTQPDRLASWVWTSTTDLLGDLGGYRWPAVLAAATAVGLLTAVRRGERSTSALVLVVFLPALVLAASLELYPFRDRLALFVLPLLLVAAAATVEARGWLGVLAGAVLLVTLVGPAERTWARVEDPVRFAESRPVMEYLVAHYEPGEQIYLTNFAEPTFDVYAGRLGLREDGYLRWRQPGKCVEPHRVDDLTGTAWLVYSYTHTQSSDREPDMVLAHADAAGRRLQVLRRDDAFAARYDFDAPPERTAAAERDESARCLVVMR